MTTYFDNLTREIAQVHRTEAVEIENEVVRTVSLACGDREFPQDMRERIMGAIAQWQMVPPYAKDLDDPKANISAIRYFDCLCSSRLVCELHAMFHEVAARRVNTRFGWLSDDPQDIVRTRDAFDANAYDTKEPA